MIVPPITAIVIPEKMYNTATFKPINPESTIKLPISTIGDAIKNENVTPIGRPAPVKPTNNGIEEHEQKGVTAPNIAAMTLALTPLKLPIRRLVLSGGK